MLNMMAAFLRGRRSSSNRWRVSLSQITSVSPWEPPSWSPRESAPWDPWQPASWCPWQPAPWDPREEAPWSPCKSSHSPRWLGPSKQLGRPHSGRPQTHAKPADALTSARHSTQTGPGRSREGPLTCGYSVRITSFRRIGLKSYQICSLYKTSLYTFIPLTLAVVLKGHVVRCSKVCFSTSSSAGASNFLILSYQTSTVM
jgi:hypothetical protein